MRGVGGETEVEMQSGLYTSIFRRRPPPPAASSCPLSQCTPPHPLHPHPLHPTYLGEELSEWVQSRKQHGSDESNDMLCTVLSVSISMGLNHQPFLRRNTFSKSTYTVFNNIHIHQYRYVNGTLRTNKKKNGRYC